MPKESEKWFIRPHHIENLTRHPNSIRNEVFNTHYYSHYNKNYGKVPEVNDSQLACEHIENLLGILKERQV